MTSDHDESAARHARKMLRQARAELERRARVAAVADMEVYSAQLQVKRWEYAVAHPEVGRFLPSVTARSAGDA